MIIKDVQTGGILAQDGILSVRLYYDGDIQSSIIFISNLSNNSWYHTKIKVDDKFKKYENRWEYVKDKINVQCEHSRVKVLFDEICERIK